MIHFRDYQKDDFREVIQLWQDTGMGSPQRGDGHELISDTIEAGGKFIIMLLNDKIIGTAWITDDKRRLYLHHFGILPKYQSKGYGHELMKETMRFVKQRGMQTKLEVHGDNTVAIHLYEKYGFRSLGNYETMIIRHANEIQNV